MVVCRRRFFDDVPVQVHFADTRSASWAQPALLSPANTAEPATVSALLSSSDLVQLAWGAQLAANYQQKKFIPLFNFLDADLQLSAFDPLIRLDAGVPEQSPANFLNDRDTLEPIIVPLARDPNAHAFERALGRREQLPGYMPRRRATRRGCFASGPSRRL
jgi:hypothetical protein